METYFYEAFTGLQRLGPGSEPSTVQATSYLSESSISNILDIGCGVGTHTFLLAKYFPEANIIAIDNNPEFINALNNTANLYGLSERVKGICMSMFEMTFQDESFDLIWSEGAIYITGFTKGLSDWKRYLKHGGHLVCSEISWLVNNPSPENQAFWQAEYAEMATIETKLVQASEIGYRYISHFVCPEEDWTENYYNPIEKNIEQMKRKYVSDKAAQQVIDMLEQEIDLYRRFGHEYSYVFYILQKV